MRFRKIDIEFISEIEKKNRFIKINRHVFELLLEQKKIITLSNVEWSSNKILNDFLIDIEIIELKWKNDCFVKKVNKISKKSQIK